MTDYQVCAVCRYLWCALVLGACTYLVFFKDASAWWFLLAIGLCVDSFDCDTTRRD